jgi:iron complex outermembrane receptor protein
MNTQNSATDPGHSTTLANKGQTYDTQGDLLALTVAHEHDTAQGSFKVYSTEGYGEQKPGLKSSFKTSGLRWRENLQPWQGGQVQAGLDVDKIGGDVATVGFTAPDLRVTSPFVAVSHKFELGQCSSQNLHTKQAWCWRKANDWLYVRKCPRASAIRVWMLRFCHT